MFSSRRAFFFNHCHDVGQEQLVVIALMQGLVAFGYTQVKDGKFDFRSLALPTYIYILSILHELTNIKFKPNTKESAIDLLFCISWVFHIFRIFLSFLRCVILKVPIYFI